MCEADEPAAIIRLEDSVHCEQFQTPRNTHHIDNQLCRTRVLQVCQACQQRQLKLIEAIRVLEAAERKDARLAVVEHEELRDAKTPRNVPGGSQCRRERDVLERCRVEHDVARIPARDGHR